MAKVTGRRAFLGWMLWSSAAWASDKTSLSEDASALYTGSIGHRQPAVSEEIRLWPDAPPGGGGPEGAPHVGHHGAVSHIATPVMRMVLPERPNGTSVLIAAGGGYRFEEIEKEAMAGADWLTARGVTAFVLTYRLPGEGWLAGPKAPLQDAARAMRLIRSRARSLSLDPDRIGCMGFSAGGHLMGMLATRFDERLYPPQDAADSLSARPDFAILAYPVITLKPPYDHTSTRKQLIGSHPSAKETAEWSVETHVKKGDPPFFLVQAKDDPISNIENSMIMRAALKKAGVPVKLEIMDKGGHGFAMGKGHDGHVTWTPMLETWMRSNDLL
ncbi:alpha/beta hydrolase [Allorhizobium sp. BGMRC 0089]|uniref:alpha/beta hydrolase n=1 Tax=Allorhizobium sonneratiae TaxID=2934936 RepID=UPI002033CAD6|nr:alpha/beta hydrolase [Allorhizobium sonneratiae]MCM2292246.1 alpha/beta hydrolase [Allorhizobium sonneratiae]